MIFKYQGTKNTESHRLDKIHRKVNELLQSLVNQSNQQIPKLKIDGLWVDTERIV